MRGKAVIYILHKYILGNFGKEQKSNRLNKQQISKTRDYKNNRFQQHHISENNRFQDTTHFKKQQIPKKQQISKIFKNNN